MADKVQEDLPDGQGLSGATGAHLGETVGKRVQVVCSDPKQVTAVLLQMCSLACPVE